MGLIKFLTLALATGASASTYYGNPPPVASASASSGQGNVVVATTVVTVTSVVKGPPAASFSLPPGFSSWVPGAPTGTPVLTVPVPPVSSHVSDWINLSSFEPEHPHNITTIEPITTVTPQPLNPGPTTFPSENPPYTFEPPVNTTVVETFLVVSGTANSTSHFHYGSPTGSAVATKTTGPNSGVGKGKLGIAVSLAALAVAVLGA